MDSIVHNVGNSAAVGAAELDIVVNLFEDRERNDEALTNAKHGVERIDAARQTWRWCKILFVKNLKARRVFNVAHETHCVLAGLSRMMLPDLCMGGGRAIRLLVENNSDADQWRLVGGSLRVHVNETLDLNRADVGLYANTLRRTSALKRAEHSADGSRNNIVAVQNNEAGAGCLGNRTGTLRVKVFDLLVDKAACARVGASHFTPYEGSYGALPGRLKSPTCAFARGKSESVLTFTKTHLFTEGDWSARRTCRDKNS